MSRKALWQWVFSSVEPAHRRHRTPSLLVRRKIESKDEYELIHLGVWIDKEKNLVYLWHWLGIELRQRL
ncbi:hypothetical protein A0J48_023090 [Sphaerospermopsis aphanizomenoides BCCUSP55]|nr:hypothetical protein [Sphaerospermopsis aphanizomenoides BCCUSP55]